jgi:hypothetical protein
MCTTEKTEQQDTSSSGEDIAALNAAFDFLYGGLRDGKKLFEANNSGGREGAIHSLEVLVKFLSQFRPVLDEGLNAPLIALFNALLTLNDGNVLPILKPAPARGRSRASGIRDGLKGAAAFTVARLRATGRSVPDAREDVARVFRDAGVTTARGRYPTVTRRTVRGWCEEVAADMGRRGEAAQTFDGLQSEYLVLDGTNPIDFEGAELANIRRAYLDSLANLINDLRGSEQ